jgi:hypothetical protein
VLFREPDALAVAPAELDGWSAPRVWRAPWVTPHPQVDTGWVPVPLLFEESEAHRAPTVWPHVTTLRVFSDPADMHQTALVFSEDVVLGVRTLSVVLPSRVWSAVLDARGLSLVLPSRTLTAVVPSRTLLVTPKDHP